MIKKFEDMAIGHSVEDLLCNEDLGHCQTLQTNMVHLIQIKSHHVFLNDLKASST